MSIGIQKVNSAITCHWHGSCLYSDDGPTKSLKYALKHVASLGCKPCLMVSFILNLPKCRGY